MKRKLVLMMLSALLAVSAAGCGSSAAENSTETASAELTETTESIAVQTGKYGSAAFSYDTEPSASYELNVDELVTAIPEYTGMEISVSSDYEITEEHEDDYLYQILSYYGYETYPEITDRDTVEETDMVKVDYTGYLDGEAFDGGSATDALISADGSGYIDGFTDALIGAKVGDEVSEQCTFPEEYSAENLAGQEVTFEFTIKGIYSGEPYTFATITDEVLEAGIGQDYPEYGTVDAMKEAVDYFLNSDLYSAETTAIEDQLVEGTTAEVPEDYLESRVNEYLYSIAQEYCTDGSTLEEYFETNYYETLDQIRSDLTDAMKDQIIQELALKKIAEEQNLEVDEEALTERVALLAENNGYESTEAYYEYIGYGDAAAGELYIRDQYLMSQALQYVIDNAVITFEE